MTPITLLLGLTTTAFGQQTLQVPNQYATPQTAVNAANNGDTILFTDDVIADWTVTGKTLTVTSSGGAWQGELSVTNGANVTIQDMDLSGLPPENDPVLVGLGVYCDANQLVNGAPPNVGVIVSAATLLVTGTEMECYNAAISATNNSDVTVQSSEFRYNYYGAAINQISGNLNIDNSIFEFNSGSGAGGGVRSLADSTVIQDSKFYANTVTRGDGGGVYAASDVIVLDNNEFLNNYTLVWHIPGIVIADPQDLIAAGNTVAGLVVGIGRGAGAYVEDPLGGAQADLTVHDNTFCGNLADEGAGLYIDDVRRANVRNNRLADNWAMHFGGGLYLRAMEEWTDAGDEATIVNNTFINNTAGQIPPPYPPLLTVIGGGGHMAFDGTVVDFRNNIVANADFGGGIMGIDGPDYVIGDFLTMDYNIFYWNCDEEGCPAGTPELWQHFTGDINQISLPATNIELEPFATYFGEGEFNCVPDAFYPLWGSPAVRSGDAVNEPNQYSPNFSDIGAYGGPGANVLDRDGDNFENIYDCNDEAPVAGVSDGGGSVFPGAPEICDQFDNDCDGEIDEGFDTFWYIDADGDGYGDVNQIQPLVECSPPVGYVLNRDDCDDQDATVNPAQIEICDGLDNDCDFAADGGLPFIPLYNDNDGDNYGAGVQFDGCPAQDGNLGYYVVQDYGPPTLVTSGLVENDADCNDFNAGVSPTAIEECDGLDNDCNMIVDDAVDGGEQYYVDGDGDGYGTGNGTFACEPPDPNSVTLGGDCDDFAPTVNPGAEEICDEIDNDCDGTTDRDAADAPVVYKDSDNDGFGNDATANNDCNPPADYDTLIGGDCDDSDPTVGQCSECGCQATPTPTSTGLFALALMGIFGFRRREER